jgi:TRAP-type C4-dicarboxylate transport system substrate-binding protein
VQAALAKRLAEAALKQREDIARLNKDAEGALTKAGISFNRPDTTPFREMLRSAGFYAQWKAKFGDEAWAKLEKYAGRLA